MRIQAQELHRNVVALETQDKASTKADLEKLQSKARALGGSLKARADTEKGAVKARMHEAGVKLSAERAKMGESIHETADAIKGKVEHAKAKLLDGITSAVRSLSEAVAAKRTSEHASSSKIDTKVETKVESSRRLARPPTRHRRVGACEPPRESCRLHSLRGWSYVRAIEEVSAGVA